MAVLAVLQGPANELDEFIQAGQYMADRKDQLTNNHVAQVQCLINEAGGVLVARPARPSRSPPRLPAPVVYDALGRPLMVWQPDRSKRDGNLASREFRSGNEANALQWVSTLTVNSDNSPDITCTL